MADDSPKSSNPFDVTRIEQLVALMSQHDLHEIDLRQGDARIRLLRGAPPGPAVLAAPAHAALSGAPAPATTPTAPPVAAEAPARPVHQIKSPVVGTFYDREKPESSPYVAVGTRVNLTTVVGLVEAMKIFNEIQAECSGIVVRKLVENAQPVEYGQVLYEVDAAG